MLVGSTSLCSSQSIKLFLFGCILAVVLLTFQYEHKLRLFNSPRLMFTVPALTLVSICGFGAGKDRKKKPRIFIRCLFFSNSISWLSLSDGTDLFHFI